MRNTLCPCDHDPTYSEIDCWEQLRNTTSVVSENGLRYDAAVKSLPIRAASQLTA